MPGTRDFLKTNILWMSIITPWDITPFKLYMHIVTHIICMHTYKHKTHFIVNLQNIIFPLAFSGIFTVIYLTSLSLWISLPSFSTAKLPLLFLFLFNNICILPSSLEMFCILQEDMNYSFKLPSSRLCFPIKFWKHYSKPHHSVNYCYRGAFCFVSRDYKIIFWSELSEFSWCK